MTISALPIALEQYEALGREIRCVMLQPNWNSQHLFLAHLMQQAGTLYVRLDGQQLSHAQAAEQISTMTAGQPLNDALLIVDECDRLNSAELETLLQNLLASDLWRLVVLSRRSVFLTSGALRAQTRMLPHVPQLMLSDYAQHEPGTGALLEVWSLGSGRVMLNGRLISIWDGILPRNLFFYMIDRGMTTRAEIFSTFWPNLSNREATNVFHVTKRKIKEVLRVEFTTYSTGFYHLSSDIHLRYDTQVLTECISQANLPDTVNPASLLGYVLALYRGHFLTTIQMPWAVQRREELVEQISEALLRLGNLEAADDRLEAAFNLFLRASSASLSREDVVLRGMQMAQQLQRHADALRLYARLETTLAQHGIQPAPAIRELAEAIRRENGSSAAHA